MRVEAGGLAVAGIDDEQPLGLEARSPPPGRPGRNRIRCCHSSSGRVTRGPRRGTRPPGSSSASPSAYTRALAGSSGTSSTTSSLIGRPRQASRRASADVRAARTRRTDSAASSAEFSGWRSSATAHISSPMAAAKPSTNQAPVSGTAVRLVPSSSSSRSESSSTLPRRVPAGAVHPEGAARLGRDVAAGDPQATPWPRRRSWPCDAWPTTGCEPRPAARARGCRIAWTTPPGQRRRRQARSG